MRHVRQARIDAVAEDGSFTMTLATEGEASDGDILSIAGGQIPERMPLLLSHYNDPTATAGSVTEPRKALKEKPPRLRATGQIELGGDGTLADVRRDVAFMIAQGHVGAVSVRWDEVEGGKAPIRRVNLPSDHPHFVDAETETSWRKRNGFFWPEWRALEGSIVALGADPEALIGRSHETQGEVRAFWRAMAEEAEKDDGSAKIAAALAALRIDAADCRESGASTADLLNAVIDRSGEDFEAIEIGERTYFLPATAAVSLRSPAEEPAPDPEPTREETPDRPSPLELDASAVVRGVDAATLVSAFMAALDEGDRRFSQTAQEMIDLAIGKVNR